MGHEVQQPKWVLEMQAYQALQRLMESANEARSLFDRAGLNLPEPLARFLGDIPGGATPGVARMIVTPPVKPPKPSGYEEGWIWVPLVELQMTSLVLGVMREAGKPMSNTEVIEKVRTYRPIANRNGILNVIARLSSTDGKNIIRRDKAVVGSDLTLSDPNAAPLFYEENAWGPPGVFLRQDVSAFRRQMIYHLLSAAPDGFQVMQLVRLMRQDESLIPPEVSSVSKDMIELDLEAMEAQQKVKRIGKDRKWIALTA